MKRKADAGDERRSAQETQARLLVALRGARYVVWAKLKPIPVVLPPYRHGAGDLLCLRMKKP